ncbi:hypothetical protein [Streptomyces sp. NPDC046909]|uniref:hypothetical protein n=1 Tax=Streptomyces sp. NPDC046909 TaxID=3155617 RepID=UPI0033CF99E2
MAASAQLLLSALSKPTETYERYETHEPHLCVFSAEGAAAEPPLTSEPPLPDAEQPLTSEPPLADPAHLTSESDAGTEL